MEQMNNNFLPLSIMPIILLLLIPTALVSAQTSPWILFQRLCQSGGLATGPQCQNLGTSSSSSVCGTNAILQNGVCVPTTSSTTTNGVCGTNAILQNGVCVLQHLPQLQMVSVVLTLYYKTVSVYLQHLPQLQMVSVVLTLYYKTVSVYLQQHRHYLSGQTHD